jgi:hypothetical protein
MNHAGQNRRTGAVWTLAVLLLIQGLGGLAGGASLAAAPSGRIMRMSTSLLSGSPFHDYLIPGFILGIVLGVVPIIVLAALMLRRPWSWYGSFTVGCALIVWLIVEYLIIGFAALQVAFGVVGVLILLVALVPSVRRYCGLHPIM